MRHPDAVRSEWHALYKDCNAALAILGRSLRASQEAIICVVVLPWISDG
jgi:hypothetical protein